MQPSFTERHFTPSQLAEMWSLSYDKVLELFRAEPGVVKIQNEASRKRQYCTIRIPESVAERVHRRMSVC